MRELLRRVLLTAGFLAAAWYFWYTPATIIGARVLDLEGEYQARVARRYVTPQSNAPAKPAGSSFVRNHSNPGSPQRYRQHVLESRPLPHELSLPASWVKSLQDAAMGNGPFVGRRHRNLVYFSADEAPLEAVASPLRKSLGLTGFVNAYMTVGTHDLEFLIFPEPRSSDAPSAVMYPQRALAIPWALGALALYALLGWPARKDVRYDPVPVAVLDVVAAGGAAFLWALPLRLAPSTAAAIGDPIGGPVWFWTIALLPVLALLSLARREAYGIVVTPEALRFRSLFRTRIIPFTDIQAAATETPDAIQSTITLQLRSGEKLRLPWAGMQGLLSLVDTLRRYGLLHAGPFSTS
ncbi:MAG: hypothetical protein KIT83_04560 [Bryobacterales bacterium]|nr:hypothetical protein [Bryobacterales bacterium]